jgi:hypothetical protein
MLGFRQQAGTLPVGDQRVFDSLRAQREQAAAAVLPDQPAGFAKCLIVENVERHDIGTVGTFAGGRRLAPLLLHGDEVDESAFAVLTVWVTQKSAARLHGV